MTNLRLVFFLHSPATDSQYNPLRRLKLKPAELVSVQYSLVNLGISFNMVSMCFLLPLRYRGSLAYKDEPVLSPHPRHTSTGLTFCSYAFFPQADDASEQRIAKLWRLTDRFTNWLRTPGIEDTLQVRIEGWM